MAKGSGQRADSGILFPSARMLAKPLISSGPAQACDSLGDSPAPKGPCPGLLAKATAREQQGGSKGAAWEQHGSSKGAVRGAWPQGGALNVLATESVEGRAALQHRRVLRHHLHRLQGAGDEGCGRCRGTGLCAGVAKVCSAMGSAAESAAALDRG